MRRVLSDARRAPEHGGGSNERTESPPLARASMAAQAPRLVDPLAVGDAIMSPNKYVSDTSLGIDQIWADFGRDRTDRGPSWRTSCRGKRRVISCGTAKLDPSSTKSVAKSTRRSQLRSTPGLIWSAFDRCRTDFGQLWLEIVQSWPEFGRCWTNIGGFRPMPHGRPPISAKHGPASTILGPISTHLARFRPISSEIRGNLERFWPNVGHVVWWHDR